jgi:hypothetical protein
MKDGNRYEPIQSGEERAQGVFCDPRDRSRTADGPDCGFRTLTVVPRPARNRSSVPFALLSHQLVRIARRVEKRPFSTLPIRWARRDPNPGTGNWCADGHSLSEPLRRHSVRGATAVQPAVPLARAEAHPATVEASQ